jgi:hypothetical protein
MLRKPIAVALFALLLFASTARAQQRPLVTQDPETIGTGRILVEGGMDYGIDILFPVSGLKGDLLRAPLVGVMVGISSIAEVQLTGGLHNRLAITDRLPAPLSSMVQVAGDTTTDVEDIVFATKIRLASENPSRPAIGLRFATRLPNASNESGLGTDTFDFYASALVGKTVQSVRVVGNVGVGILADPTRGDRQNDVLTYGLSLARAMTNEIELVGEINGRANTRTVALPGTESRATMRVGARYTRGPARFDAAALLGMTERDPGIGFALGITYIFNAFKIQ